MKLRIEKRGYSSSPWRVVDDTAAEVYFWRRYPGNDELPPYQAPLAFDTKTEAVAALGEMAGRYLELRRLVIAFLHARDHEEASVIGGCVQQLRAAVRAEAS